MRNAVTLGWVRLSIVGVVFVGGQGLGIQCGGLGLKVPGSWQGSEGGQGWGPAGLGVCVHGCCGLGRGGALLLTWADGWVGVLASGLVCWPHERPHERHAGGFHLPRLFLGPRSCANAPPHSRFFFPPLPACLPPSLIARAVVLLGVGRSMLPVCASSPPPALPPPMTPPNCPHPHSACCAPLLPHLYCSSQTLGPR